MKRRGKRSFLLWILIFFLATAAVATVSFFVYDAVRKIENTGAVVGIMISVIFFLSVVFAAFEYVRYLYFVERPVERIIDGAERISRGDFSVRIPLRERGPRDEYDRIIECMNRMAEELSKTEVLRSDFAADLSHEIKTPVAVIRGSVLALEEEKDGEKRKEYLSAVLAASERLSALVSDILKLNKLEHSALAPERMRVELGESVREAVISFEDVIEQKGISLECEIEDIAVFSSPSHLSIVWNNLLSNAVKFTPQGGTVAVAVRATEEGAEVEIRDTGCGISPETGKHIFDKFYQGDTSHAGEGNGLGLALVKKVIDLLGGEISVRSILGEGSTFTVRLGGREG